MGLKPRPARRPIDLGAPECLPRSRPIERTTAEVRKQHRIARLVSELRELGIKKLEWSEPRDGYLITYGTTEVFPVQP